MSVQSIHECVGVIKCTLSGAKERYMHHMHDQLACVDLRSCRFVVCKLLAGAKTGTAICHTCAVR